MNNKVTIYTKCSCGTEILELEYYPDDSYKEYYLTMFHASVDVSVWNRLKNAARYALRGEFEGNSIVLTHEEYNTFVDTLIQHKR